LGAVTEETMMFGAKGKMLRVKFRVTTDEQHAAPLSVDAVAPGRWRGKIQQYGQQRSGASAEALEQGRRARWRLMLERHEILVSFPFGEFGSFRAALTRFDDRGGFDYGSASRRAPPGRGAVTTVETVRRLRSSGRSRCAAPASFACATSLIEMRAGG